MAKRSLPARVLSALWNGITRVRLALSNLLFLALLAVIWFVYIGGTPEPLPEQAALLLNLSGTVVDQRSPVDPLQALLVESSPAAHEVLLRDLLDAIEFAADDPAITALVLELDALGYVGISKTQEIVEALTVFRDNRLAGVTENSQGFDNFLTPASRLSRSAIISPRISTCWPAMPTRLLSTRWAGWRWRVSAAIAITSRKPWTRFQSTCMFSARGSSSRRSSRSSATICPRVSVK